MDKRLRISGTSLENHMKNLIKMKKIKMRIVAVQATMKRAKKESNAESGAAV